MKITAVRCLTVASVAALALTGCGSSSSNSAASASAGAKNTTPYKVLVSGAATGPMAAQGSTAINAAKAAVDLVNSEGGVAGRKIALTVVDDNGDATTAVTALQKAIASDKPDAYLNSGPSTIATATLPILTSNNILSFNTGPTADSADATKYPLNFDLAQSSATGVKGVAEEVVRKGYKSVGIIHGNSAYGQSFGANAEKAVTGAGAKVVANVEYDTKALDMTPQLEKVKEGSPDVVVLDAYGAPVGYVLKGIEKLGWSVPILGNTSVTATSLIGTPAPEGVLGTPGTAHLTIEATPSVVYSANATAVNDAVKRMTKLGDIKTSLILAVNYDGILLIRAAAKKAGSADDPKALATALVDPQLQKDAKTVITTLYAYSKDKHAPSANLDKTFYSFVAPAPMKQGQLHPNG